jgi:hypothetical protein
MPLYLSRSNYTPETWARALAMTGGGALSSLETTVLLTVDEMMDALRKAKQVRYRASGA